MSEFHPAGRLELFFCGRLVSGRGRRWSGRGAVCVERYTVVFPYQRLQKGGLNKSDSILLILVVGLGLIMVLVVLRR